MARVGVAPQNVKGGAAILLDWLDWLDWMR